MIADARVEGYDEELAATEPELLDRAERGDHRSLEILTRHFRACARAEGSRPEPPDRLTVAAVGDRCVGRFDVDASAGQTIREAIEKFTRPPAANDGTSLAVRQAEGLVRMCEVALSRGTHAEGSRRVVSYVTQERTAEDVIEPITLGTWTGVIGPQARDRILCDATISRIVAHADGTTADVGRATNVWPVAIRRLIVTRDRCCQWPGCEMPAEWCDVHHVLHWEHGGPTDASNGVLECRRHHVFLHAHPDWTSTFEHQVFRVFRPDGTEVHPDAWAGTDRAVRRPLHVGDPPCGRSPT